MRRQNGITWEGPRCEGGRELLGLKCSTLYKQIKRINVQKCTNKFLKARLICKSYSWIRWPGDQTTLANLGCADQKSVSKCFIADIEVPKQNQVQQGLHSCQFHQRRDQIVYIPLSLNKCTGINWFTKQAVGEIDLKPITSSHCNFFEQLQYPVFIDIHIGI